MVLNSSIRQVIEAGRKQQKEDYVRTAIIKAFSTT